MYSSLTPLDHAKKYGERGATLYARQDAIAAAHAQLASHARELSTVWVGAFDDEAVSRAVAAPPGLHPSSLLVRQHLMPRLEPDDIVVLDNLKAHHAKGIRELIESRGATLLYLPPYSPDLNPIELAWSKIKALIRAAAARSLVLLRIVALLASRCVTPWDASAWFKHCGVAQVA